jgi:hypothetical protein
MITHQKPDGRTLDMKDLSWDAVGGEKILT